MKIRYIYDEINKATKELEAVDFTNRMIMHKNQPKVYEAYRILENLKQEIIKEVKRKHV